jgi:BirA family biotin operon repressor/biotin-[acetyl-CoA-carboxylase] ligase
VAERRLVVARPPPLGTPRLHLRTTDSTNNRARALALGGAPHGTLVTSSEQSAGRGRQGRSWFALPRRALLCSLVLREPPALLSLVGGVAVAEVVNELAVDDRRVGIKWPNDVLLADRKVAGVLVEARPQERWSILGIGLNVALRPEDLPVELQGAAATLGLEPEAIQEALELLLERLAWWLARSDEEVLEAVRRRDALRGRSVIWQGGTGTAAGIDPAGRLLVRTADGDRALDAGDVHLLTSATT